MTYQSSACDGVVRQFVNALVVLNELQDKVPEEIEDAVGRLRDRFQFLPGQMQNILMGVDLEEKTFVKEASEDAISVIDQLRSEMDKRGTTKVLKYTAKDPRQDLRGIINRLQASLLREANENLSDCYCTSVCPNPRRT